MRKILVTAVSGDIANGILKILQSEDNLLYGCDVNEIAVGMDRVEEFWKSKYAVEDGYVEEILQKCETYQISHLIPVNEREIEVIGKARTKFEEKGIKLVIQEQHVLDICLDKYETMKLLQKHGILVPETYLNMDEIGDKRGTYICKPRKSNGSRDIFFYVPEKDADVRSDLDGYIIQQYIDSPEEYTIGVFRQEERINSIAFRRELKNGYSHLVELAHDAKLDSLAAHVAELLDLEGYVNIQLRKLEGEYYIFEINPRISGTVRFRHMLGFSDLLWWLDMLDGKTILPYRCGYEKAVGIRELNEKYLILE